MSQDTVYRTADQAGAQVVQRAADQAAETVAFVPLRGRVGPLSDSDASSPPNQADNPNKRWLSRVARIAAAVALCAVATAFIYDRFFDISSGKAALSGMPLVVRAPIDGILTTSHALPGAVLEAGESFGQIANDNVDGSRLTDLTARISETKAEITALKARLQAVESEERDALANADLFRETRMQQLAAQIEENDAALRAANAKLLETQNAFRRSETLLVSGDTSPALAEQVRRAHAVAESELAAAVDRRNQLQVALAGARAGVFVSGNSNDRSIAQQEQARMRVVHQELSAALAEHEGRLAALQIAFNSEQDRLAKRRTAELPLPARARLTELRARSGEYVQQGQEIATFADCAFPTVTTEVDERVFRSLRLGMRAVFSAAGSLAGNQGAHEGWVMQLVPPLLTPNGSSADQHGGYRVIVRLQADRIAEACDTGRVGRIKFF